MSRSCALWILGPVQLRKMDLLTSLFMLGFVRSYSIFQKYIKIRFGQFLRCLTKSKCLINFRRRQQNLYQTQFKANSKGSCKKDLGNNNATYLSNQQQKINTKCKTYHESTKRVNQHCLMKMSKLSHCFKMKLQNKNFCIWLMIISHSPSTRDGGKRRTSAMQGEASLSRTTQSAR